MAYMIPNADNIRSNEAPANGRSTAVARVHLTQNEMCTERAQSGIE